MARRLEDGSAPTRQHISEAGRLIEACLPKEAGADSIATAVETVCHNVTAHLDPLISRRAAQALLARAVYLSMQRFTILKSVSTAEADVSGVASQLADCLRAAKPAQAMEISVSVLAHFVWLLTRFISEELGLRLLRESVPGPDEDKR